MSNNVKKLILIDHDGTLCQTNPFAYESIKYATTDIINKLNLTTNISASDWDEIFCNTMGTTEKNLARSISNILGIGMDDFDMWFYSSRANWYRSMQGKSEFIFDTYYSDAEYLIGELFNDPTNKIMMVTGNPEEVMNIRLSRHMKKYFCDEKDDILGGFGDECYTRQELIINAIADAKRLFGFIPMKNNSGFCDNVFYIGDGYNDFKAGITARVKTIWIPSRSLPAVREKVGNEHIKLLLDVLDNNVMVTNNLESKEVCDFVL